MSEAIDKALAELAKHQAAAPGVRLLRTVLEADDEDDRLDAFDALQVLASYEGFPTDAAPPVTRAVVTLLREGAIEDWEGALFLLSSVNTKDVAFANRSFGPDEVDLANTARDNTAETTAELSKGLDLYVSALAHSDPYVRAIAGVLVADCATLLPKGDGVDAAATAIARQVEAEIDEDVKAGLLVSSCVVERALGTKDGLAQVMGLLAAPSPLMRAAACFSAAYLDSTDVPDVVFDHLVEVALREDTATDATLSQDRKAKFKWTGHLPSFAVVVLRVLGRHQPERVTAALLGIFDQRLERTSQPLMDIPLQHALASLVDICFAECDGMSHEQMAALFLSEPQIEVFARVLGFPGGSPLPVLVTQRSLWKARHALATLSEHHLSQPPTAAIFAAWRAAVESATS